MSLHLILPSLSHRRAALGLMVGFTAEYESGTIKPQEDELTAGTFYRKDNLPHIPQKMSIARKLIDWWLSKQ